MTWPIRVRVYGISAFRDPVRKEQAWRRGTVGDSKVVTTKMQSGAAALGPDLQNGQDQ